MQSWGFIQRHTSEFTGAGAIITSYKSLVRPILEYCSVVWTLAAQIWIDLLQRPQRKLRYVSYKRGTPMHPWDHDYSNILNYLKIVSLKHRKFVIDSLFLFKLINDMIDALVLLSQISLRVPRINSRNHKLFYEKKNKFCLLF